MLSAEQACAIVLDLHKDCLRDGLPERFVIQSCELSPRGDYWVVRCNTEDCVLHGRTEYCYVGVNAHLVHRQTGALDTVASCLSVDQYLQDKRDREAAGDQFHVLTPAIARTDQPAQVNLRRQLACTYPQMLALLSAEHRQWLTGTRRQLQEAQRLLAIQGIETCIELQPQTAGAIPIGPQTWHIEAVFQALRTRLAALPGQA